MIRNTCDNQDHAYDNQDLQNCRGQPEADSDLGIPGRERKDANLKVNDNTRKRAGTIKRQKISKSPTNGDRNIKEVVRSDGSEVRDVREGIGLF